MAYAGDNPDGYYVGRPVQQPPAPATGAQAVDEPVKAQVPGVPGYYAGRVQGKKADATGNHGSAQPKPSQDPQNTDQGFLARWFRCFSGGGGTQ